nr:peptide deformylase [Clostridia bacterium]
MALRRVVKIGDEALRKVARPIPEINRRVLTLLDDMAETMYAENGCGLAAPQV